jgi:hypothetical protein
VSPSNEQLAAGKHAPTAPRIVAYGRNIYPFVSIHGCIVFENGFHTSTHKVLTITAIPTAALLKRITAAIKALIQDFWGSFTSGWLARFLVEVILVAQQINVNILVIIIITDINIHIATYAAAAWIPFLATGIKRRWALFTYCISWAVLCVLDTNGFRAHARKLWDRSLISHFDVQSTDTHGTEVCAIITVAAGLVQIATTTAPLHDLCCDNVPYSAGA